MNKYIAASPGIGMGKAYKLVEPEININNRGTVTSDCIDSEVLRLRNAVVKSRLQLKEIYDYMLLNMGKEQADIISAHITILEDPMMIDIAINKICNEKIRAENALLKTIDEQLTLFEGIEDPYLRERSSDIKDVGYRVVKNLLDLPFKDISILDEDVILVAEDITPSMLAEVDIKHVKGLISEKGGKTSHSAILARSMEIPAVFGAKGIVDLLNDGQVVAIDGDAGTIELCTDSKKEELKQRIRQEENMKKELQKYKYLATLTRDGKRIRLEANIGSLEDVKKAIDNGAEGIGLFRTEFLYVDRSNMPAEDEQFNAYRYVVESMAGKPVTIRTLDIGGDKGLSCFQLPSETNPFLGWRGIRICLENLDMFKAQFRAILRASAFGKVRIMYPMITSVDEVISANKILDEVKHELRTSRCAFDENIEKGVMIEVPSAAITADLIIKEVDFFSIGTNDLTQYTLAVDRTNEKVSSMYNSFHPAVLRLIKNVIEISHGEGKYTGMCGELAGDPDATLLLLKMGLDEFSMTPSSILKIRKTINSTNLERFESNKQMSL